MLSIQIYVVRSSIVLGMISYLFRRPKKTDSIISNGL